MLQIRWTSRRIYFYYVILSVARNDLIIFLLRFRGQYLKIMIFMSFLMLRLDMIKIQIHERYV